MKGRESGMPDESLWHSFFDPEGVADSLAGPQIAGNVAEFGCGYGTFTLAFAARTQGIFTAMDIEPALILRVRQHARVAGLANVRALLRDFVQNGTGLAAGSQSHVMIYNLLHLEQPLALLAEAGRCLEEGGRLSVINWRTDIETPRGPPPAIRPSASQCTSWMAQAGFREVEGHPLGLCAPYHYGLTACWEG